MYPIFLCNFVINILRKYFIFLCSFYCFSFLRKDGSWELSALKRNNRETNLIRRTFYSSRVCIWRLQDIKTFSLIFSKNWNHFKSCTFFRFVVNPSFFSDVGVPLAWCYDVTRHNASQFSVNCNCSVSTNWTRRYKYSLYLPYSILSCNGNIWSQVWL